MWCCCDALDPHELEGDIDPATNNYQQFSRSQSLNQVERRNLDAEEDRFSPAILGVQSLRYGWIDAILGIKSRLEMV